MQGNAEPEECRVTEFVEVAVAPANMRHGRVVLSSADSITEFVDSADEDEGDDD